MEKEQETSLKDFQTNEVTYFIYFNNYSIGNKIYKCFEEYLPSIQWNIIHIKINEKTKIKVFS